MWLLRNLVLNENRGRTQEQVFLFSNNILLETRSKQQGRRKLRGSESEVETHDSWNNILESYLAFCG